MRDIDVISFVSCSGTLIYIINFQFQPNLRWSNFRPYYCDIESLKWPAGSEFSCQSAPNGLIFFLSSFLRAATTGIFVSKTFSKIDILYQILLKILPYPHDRFVIFFYTFFNITYIPSIYSVINSPNHSLFLKYY